MDIIQAALLAIIQGISEWLPISSSAHLAVAQILMGIQPPVFFDIMLHAGTLIAAIAYFRHDILHMLAAIIKFDRKNVDFRLATLLIVASIPTAIIGFAFKGFFEASFSNPFNIGIAMVITGAFLFYCEKKIGNKPLMTGSALAIGVAQGVAVMPGISRSGATIGTGLLLGVGRGMALRFSFLLSIPAILGAAIFEFKEIGPSGVPMEVVLPAAFISAITGYFAIGFMIDFVRRRGLKPFSYYCLLVGLAMLASATLYK